MCYGIRYTVRPQECPTLDISKFVFRRGGGRLITGPCLQLRESQAANNHKRLRRPFRKMARLSFFLSLLSFEGVCAEILFLMELFTFCESSPVTSRCIPLLQSQSLSQMSPKSVDARCVSGRLNLIKSRKVLFRARMDDGHVVDPIYLPF